LANITDAADDLLIEDCEAAAQGWWSNRWVLELPPDSHYEWYDWVRELSHERDPESP